MNYTSEQLDELSDRQLEEIAHELTGNCWHHIKALESFAPERENGYSTFCLKCNRMDVEDENLSYTTDFNDAFELVAFAESKGFQFDLHDNTSQFYPRQADVVVYKTTSEIPKAITKAFILALSEKE